MTKLLTGTQIGIGGGLIAWSCCISAVVLGFMGFSTAAAFFAMVQDRYHWWLVALAFISFDAGIYYMLKHYHGTCDFRVIRNNAALITFFVLMGLFTYFVLQAILPSLMELSQR